MLRYVFNIQVILPLSLLPLNWVSLANEFMLERLFAMGVLTLVATLIVMMLMLWWGRRWWHRKRLFAPWWWRRWYEMFASKQQRRSEYTFLIVRLTRSLSLHHFMRFTARQRFLFFRFLLFIFIWQIRIAIEQVVLSLIGHVNILIIQITINNSRKKLLEQLHALHRMECNVVRYARDLDDLH